MRIILLLILCLKFTTIYSQDNRVFPKKIENTLTENHTRVKTTNGFLIIPEEYEYIESLSRFQKENRLYLQIVNFPLSIEKTIVGFSKEVIEVKGAKVNYEEELIINGKKAKYLDGDSKYDGETKLVLVLGDSTNTFIMVGVHENHNTLGKKELQQIMQTVYLDTNTKFDPLELANFTFDQNITSFKFNTSASNVYIFTPNGDEISDEMEVPSFTISTFPKTNLQKSRDFAEDMIWRMESVGGAKLDSKELLPMKLNGKDAFVLESEIEREGKKGWINMTIIVEENSNIIFMGKTYSNIEEYKIKFRKTIKTLKEKKQ